MVIFLNFDRRQSLMYIHSFLVKIGVHKSKLPLNPSWQRENGYVLLTVIPPSSNKPGQVSNPVCRSVDLKGTWAGKLLINGLKRGTRK